MSSTNAPITRIGTVLVPVVDQEAALLIDPLVLGGGTRLFGDDGELRPLRLVEAHMTTTGAIIAYARLPSPRAR